MAKQTINVGLTANDKKGDSLRTAFQKVNANFTELYLSVGADAAGNQLVNGLQVVDLDTNGIITLPSSSYLESTDINLKVGAQGTVTIRSNAESNLTTQSWLFDIDGNLTFPNGETIVSQSGQIFIHKDNGDSSGEVVVQPDGVSIQATSLIDTRACLVTAGLNGASVQIVDSANNIFNWTFEADGTLQTPNNGRIRQNHSFTRTTSASASAATPVVVWTASEDWISGIKLTIQVEGAVTGDSTGWHVQTCEATIASRGYANGVSGYGDPEMSVYGIIYTSTNPLATFEVQRNATTRKVEVVATGSDINNNIIVSVHSVEIGTTD